MAELAAGPVSWGVDFAGAPGNPAWPEVLDGIAATGLRVVELGPLGYLPTDGAALRTELDARGLRAAGSFVFHDLHAPPRRAAAVAQAALVSRWVADAGGELLIVIDRPSPARAATAGRSEAAARLSPSARRAMLATIEQVADVARGHGLRPVLHHHAGSHVEFEDELETALAETDLDLCLDTGHALYAGMDPAALIERHGDRIAHLHLKDVDPARLDAGSRGFWESVARGVFCPLGDGRLDVPRVAAALDAIGYRGVATIEQDRRSSTPGEPVADLRTSIARLAAAGIGAQ